MARLSAVLNAGRWQIGQLYRRLPAAAWRRFARLLLIAYCCHMAAKLFWMLLPLPPLATAEVDALWQQRSLLLAASSPGAMQETAVDIEAITRLHLFGRPQDGADAPDKQPVVVIEAEETRLDLLLLGVVVSDVDAAGRAIISHRNRQDLFAIGDKLPGASQVRLQQILPGRVIIDNDGRYESLWLYEQPDTSAGLGATPQLSSAMQGATQLPVAASAAAGTSGASLTPATATPPDLPVQALEQDAPIESLADIIQFTPVHAGGRILGYRIAPGRAPQLFEKLGLKKNDVITGINGNSLDDPTRALKIYRQIQASKAANFELMRDGQTHIVEVMLEGNHA